MAFPRQIILKALKEHPEDASPKYFYNQKHKGIDLSSPQEVGKSMKTSNAIVYRLEHRNYQLMSRAYQTALKSYDPILRSINAPILCDHVMIEANVVKLYVYRL